MPPTVLEYRSRVDAARDRPPGDFWSVYAASGLCLATWWVKSKLRYDCDDVGPLMWVQLGLVAYGTSLAAWRIVRRRINGRQMVLLPLCGFVFLSTALDAILMPRLNRN